VTELFRFQVPATCAHLGPGFGVVGIALDLWMTVVVHKRADAGHVVERPGVDETRMDARHDALLRGLNAAAERFAIKVPPGLRFVVESLIPAASGLGSNSAAFAAGLAAAARLAKKRPDGDELLDLLVSLGGDAAHGAAAMHGGMTGACLISEPNDAPRHRVVPLPLDSRFEFVLACPDVHLGVADNRRILPPTLPHGATPRTSARLIGMLFALQHGDVELLGPCLRDEVHVPFRRRLVPGMDEAMRAAVEAGAVGASICGHGPGVVALLNAPKSPREAQAVVTAMAKAFSPHAPCATYVLKSVDHGALHDGG
jgi:homoserine kinase